MRALIRAAAVAILFAGLQIPRGSGAYELAGHFYTVWALAKTSEVPIQGDQDEHLLVALCAQLPDMAKEANAVTVYFARARSSPFSWAWWGMSTSVGNEDMRHMITVQQLLHGLTGGDAQATHRVAQRLVRGALDALARTTLEERPVALCALGFALHFFSDSLSHRDLSDTSDAAKMYVTGRGHAVHLSFPDFPLCAELASWWKKDHYCNFTERKGKRFDAWVKSWAAIEWPCADAQCQLQQGERDLRSDKRKLMMTQRAAALGPTANDRNRWNELALGDAFGFRKDAPQTVNWALPDRAAKFLEKTRSERPCADVVRDIAALFEKWPTVTTLDCDRIWKTYTALAVAAFEGNDVAQARAPLDTKVSFCEIYAGSLSTLSGPSKDKAPCPPATRTP